MTLKNAILLFAASVLSLVPSAADAQPQEQTGVTSANTVDGPRGSHKRESGLDGGTPSTVPAAQK